MSERKCISTQEWRDAGYSFELWLRYAQAPEVIQKQLEKVFWAKHAKGEEK